MSEQATHYDVLGVTRDAPPEAIKASYRRLAKELHPDHHPGDVKKEQRFKAVTAAYDVLSDPDRRQAYDSRLDHEARAAEQRRATEAELQATEQARRFAEEFARVQRQPPPAPPPAPATPNTTTFPWFDIVVGIAALGGIAALAYANATPSSHWDPVVQRRRGPDGRFRRGRRSKRNWARRRLVR
jgi:curved DNA-binding protein CbpA|nr:J domain-containing protein [Kofleriaceae bacterium]